MAPVPIAFGEAIAVAALGFVVNILSVCLLHDKHAHSHDHAHDHAHHDHNFRSAYLHVLADAATSVLAIIGLLAGWIYGWVWMDAAMGMIGALVIANWSWTLMRDAGRILLDVTLDPHLAPEIRKRLEARGDLITDLHVWRMGPGHFGVIVSLLADNPQPPQIYKQMLDGIPGLSHITVEVYPCPDAPKA
jgi:cation diffusion facilitator family transporter